MTTPVTNPVPPLSVAEAAEVLGVTPRAVRGLIARGSLAAVNVGGDDPRGREYRILPNHLNEFLQARITTRMECLS